MHMRRGQCTGCVNPVSGSFIVSGGYDLSDQLRAPEGLASIEIYDPVRNSWELGAAHSDMSWRRYDHTVGSPGH